MWRQLRRPLEVVQARVLPQAFRSSARVFSSTPKKELYSDAFNYTALFKADPFADTEYRELKELSKLVKTAPGPLGEDVVIVNDEILSGLAFEAFRDVSHLLRPKHLEQLASILDDPEASSNDRFVALELLKNANIASGMVLPGCQDTGTAIVMGKKGEHVFSTAESDEKALSHGVFRTYTETNLRYSQVAPLDMFKEKNTGSNLPAQIDLLATKGDEYKFLFVAKGGGSANKTALYQMTKAVLNEQSLTEFLTEKVQYIGTSACPPYHLAIVIGGLSAEQNLKTVKLASTKYYDELPTQGDEAGSAYRDLEWEAKILEITRTMGIGAQFGGKYFCHDVRVVRLPRHGASCPVGIGVSCSADRNVLAKINKDGVFLEALEREPARFLPEADVASEPNAPSDVVEIDLNQSMDALRAELTKHPIKTRLSLSGDIIVARDIAHAKIKEMMEAGEEMPDYFKDHIIYYAGPAKTPEGKASGSFGPTTAGRMDPYVGLFQQHGGSLVTLAKGNRSKAVTRACKENQGFYLGSIGGQGAAVGENFIEDVQLHRFPELGMEAVWKVRVKNFPAFIVVDDKGNDFFERWQPDHKFH